MDECSTFGQFWAHLPLTLAALAPLLAVFRGRRKLDQLQGVIEEHNEVANERLTAYDSVIEDLQHRVNDGNGDH